MKLHRLQLQNFRQFRDEEIRFAQDTDNNVTVIHGSNGSGKTTLLNAFTWLLYEEVDFDTRPDRLASEGAMAEIGPGESVTVSVILEFEHEGATYTATRTAIYEKQSTNDFDGKALDHDIVVEYDDGSGVKRRNNPENTLDQIIPERLSELFFFDGEDIDELAGIDNQDRIQESIQNIMGLTILERAKRHLDTVAGRFEDEVEEYGSDELSQLIKEKRKLESDTEELERKRDDKDRAKDRLETEIRDLEQQLERLDESAQLQTNRDQYQNEKRELESEVEEINAQLKDAITEHGYVPLAMPLIEETAEELDELRERGVIPSELSNDFLDSLLGSQQCICGRPLEPGTKHYRQVESLKGEAAAEGVEQGAIRVVGHLRQFSEKRSDFFDDIDALIAERSDCHDQIVRLEELIDEISSELQDLDQTTDDGRSVADLEQAREEKTEDRDEIIAEKARIEEQIERLEGELEDLKLEIDEQRDEQEEALIAKRRQKAAEQVRDEIDDSFEQLKNKVRKWSNKVVRNTFDEIATKNFDAEITDDFELKIRQTVRGSDERVEVDKSTGERQIASLAFVGSLVKIAKERYETDSDSEYFTGGIYPLVMDSPFGALDKDHRHEVSRILPSLAPQVVVFVTDSQWDGPVEQEMETIAGQQYWLHFDDGQGTDNAPRTYIRTEPITAIGD
jgi:DNA sulfur modification protein DndD